jgi:ABC-type multidrug transport system fused ATPase/permease subunit
MTVKNNHFLFMASNDLGQICLFLNRAAWLVRDAFQHFRRRIFTIIFLSLAGISAATVGLGGLFLLARHLEKGMPIRLAGMTVIHAGNTGAILAVVALLVLMGILSGASLYYTEWLIARFAIDYRKRLLRRLLSTISDPAYDGWQAAINDIPLTFINRLSGSGTKITALALRHLLQGILPLLTFLFAAIAMIIIQPFLSGLLFPLIVCYLMPFYRMIRNVSRQSSALRAAEPKSKRKIKKAIDLVLETEVSPKQKMEMVRNGLESEEFDNAQMLFYQRKLADNRVQALNTTFFFSCFLILFAYFLLMVPSPERSWSELILFVVALRFTISGMRKVTSTIVKLSRFYPEYKTCMEFFDSVEKIRGHRIRTMKDARPLPASLPFRCGSSENGKVEKSVTVKKGQILWVIQPTPLSPGDLKAIAVWLENETRPSVDLLKNSGFHTDFQTDTPATIAEIALGQKPDGNMEKALWKEFQRLGVDSKFFVLPNGLNTTTDDASIDTLSPEAMCAVHFGLPKPDRALFMSAGPLSKLSPDFTKQLLSFPDAYYFLVTNNPKVVFRHAFSRLDESTAGIIIMNGPEIIDLGDLDWLKTNFTRISECLKQMKSGEVHTDLNLDFNDL